MIEITTIVLTYIVAVAIFFAIDMLWLGLIAPKFYKKHIGHLLSEKPNMVIGVVFYLIFLIGLMIFAILPALISGMLSSAIMLGALFGFFTYATYDFTNWATMRGWSAVVTYVDIAWGTFLSGLVAALTFVVSSSFFL